MIYVALGKVTISYTKKIDSKMFLISIGKKGDYVATGKEGRRERERERERQREERRERERDLGVGNQGWTSVNLSLLNNFSLLNRSFPVTAPFEENP